MVCERKGIWKRIGRKVRQASGRRPQKQRRAERHKEGERGWKEKKRARIVCARSCERHPRQACMPAPSLPSWCIIRLDGR